MQSVRLLSLSTLVPLAVATLFLASCGSSTQSRTADSSSPARSMHASSGPSSASSSVSSSAVTSTVVRQQPVVTYSKAEQHQRQKPSAVAGLTQGQVDDMPVVPILPPIFGLYATQSQLETQALLTAREDVANGFVASSIEQRYQVIMQVWQDDWRARKDLLQGIKSDHAQYAERLRQSAARVAAWRRIDQAHTAAFRAEIAGVDRDGLSALSDEELRQLNDY